MITTITISISIIIISSSSSSSSCITSSIIIIMIIMRSAQTRSALLPAAISPESCRARAAEIDIILYHIKSYYMIV